MEAEEVSDDELAAVLAAPPEKKAVRRKKGQVRDLDTWFFGCEHTLDICDDPNCPDPKKGDTRHVMTTLIDGKRVCRHSFLAGYPKSEEL